MRNEPSNGNGQPADRATRRSFTPRQKRAGVEAFKGIIATAVPAYQLGQLEIFEPDDEAYIRHEVERMLYEPKLPNGGDKERHVIARLKELGRREGTGWEGYGRLQHAIQEWQAVLPDNPRNAGMYYARRPISFKQDKAGFEFYMNMKKDAVSSNNEERAWFAVLMLKGIPEAVSNFAMECLFLLRRSDGDVDRLVRLKNVVGEVSNGANHQGSDVLVGDAFAAPEKFRAWALKRGNFAWAGNQTILQLLHLDNTSAAAWRVINQVESVGAFAVRRAAMLGVRPPPPTPAAKGLLPKGWKMLDLLWFYGDCVYAHGAVLQPDGDGIYWHQEDGYYPTAGGREAEFAQRKPNMRPEEGLYRKPGELGTEPSYEMKPGRPQDEGAVMREFFSETCRAFFDTVGGYDGWLAMGMVLAYAAGPEIFAKYGFFPGLWVHGQAGSGKTITVEWAMYLQGFAVSAGIGLLATTTTVGLQQQLENYSSLALWGDEYRQGKIKEEKESLIRDSFNRQQSVKWTVDGKPRQMRTTFLVSGESTASDAALRSRFAHVQVSKARRKIDHMPWMQANKGCFFVFWRAIMERREEFVGMLARGLEDWLASPALAGMDEREKMVHGIGYASWRAANFLFESQGAEETATFKAFMVQHARTTAEEVTSETNINVFLQDLLTAFKAEAIPPTCFRLEDEHLAHPPGWPNQNGGWTSYKLYFDPNQTISAINIYLRKEGRTLSLRAKDLQAQLSKTDYWIQEPGTKRMGAKGKKSSMRVWGLDLDKLPDLGRLECPDADYDHYLRNRRDDGDDADPRRGPFYAIVAELERLDNPLPQ